MGTALNWLVRGKIFNIKATRNINGWPFSRNQRY